MRCTHDPRAASQSVNEVPLLSLTCPIRQPTERERGAENVTNRLLRTRIVDLYVFPGGPVARAAEAAHFLEPGLGFLGDRCDQHHRVQSSELGGQNAQH